MPWWVWVWLALLLLLSISGVHDDLSKRKPIWYVACSLISGLICLLGLAARYDMFVLPGPPLVLLLIALATGIWLIYDGIIDLHDFSEAEGEVSFVGLGRIVLGDLLFMPAIALGTIDVVNLLRASD